MKIQRLIILFCTIIVNVFIFSSPQNAFSAKNKPLNPYRQAMMDISRINGLPIEKDILTMIDQFEVLSLPDEKKKLQEVLFIQMRMQSWGNRLSEYLSTMKLIFSFKEKEEQERYQPQFNQACICLEKWREQLNRLIKLYHPGYQLNDGKLRQKFQGQKVNIAVFDLFEPELLEKQRKDFHSSDIQPMIYFGQPVHQQHGNSVIDIILTLAPQASILPISADHLHEIDALRYLRDRPDVHIINMSRAFVEIDKQLDRHYASLLSEILQEKIVVKSLGNTGTDLYGQLTPLRKEKKLPIPGNPFSYDLSLIRQFMTNYPSSNILFAINTNLLNNNIALTATIPGDFDAVSRQSLAVSGDGVWSQSSDNFESGSSFSAPQIAAICALLWQALTVEKNEDRKAMRIVSAIAQSAERFEKLGPEIMGQGRIFADMAWYSLGYKRNSAVPF